MTDRTRIEFHAASAKAKAAFLRACKANDLTMSQVLRQLMQQYIDKK